MRAKVWGCAVLDAKVWCSVRVLCGAKQTSKGLAWCWCYARIRCGFPVKKVRKLFCRNKNTDWAGGLWALQDAVRVLCQAKVKCLISVLVYLSKLRLGILCGCPVWC